MNIVHGIILAAGRGSRMGKGTRLQPKCFAKVAGKRLLDYQLDALKASGIAHTAIVTGYLRDAFDEKVTYFENSNWENTNMVSSLLKADDWLSRYPCIISYSDIIYDSSCVELLKNCYENICIAFDPNWHEQWKIRFNDVLDDAESFKFEGDRLIDIGQRASHICDIQGQYMGLLKTTPAGWNQLRNYLFSLQESEVAKLDMTSLLSKLIINNVNISAKPINSWWFEVDTQKDQRLAEKLIQGGTIHHHPPTPP